MSDTGKRTVRISQTAARYLRPNASREDRLLAARGEVQLSAYEIPIVQFCLCRDADPEIRAAALAGLREIPEEILIAIAGNPDTHPRLLELFARLHGGKRAVAERIAANPATDAATLSQLGVPEGVASVEGEADEQGQKTAEPLMGKCQSSSDPLEEEDLDLDEAEAEKLRSNVQLAKEMTISEKIKMAMTGDKEWRMLLVKDTNKMISGAVIKNPRITEAEILMISKSHLNNDEILRDICVNKDWTKNYQIKKSLVENHKTPLHFALRFLSSLTDKDLSAIAKSKNISSVISTQARRLLLNKQKEK